MGKNDLLLLSEVLYQLHACRSLADLERNFFYYLNLFIPFRCASYIEIGQDPRSGRQSHQVRFCHPANFAAAERKWIALQDKVNTIWLSNAAESIVVRCSELFTGDRRLATTSYQEVFQSYGIFDDLQMNLVHDGRTTGRLSFYRTQADGAFSDQDCDSLRLLSKHINLVFSRCLQAGFAPEADLSALAQAHGLTRREEEVLGCIFQGMDNAEICNALKISKNTLYKHNNSIFQKCGVRSRWDLLKLRQ